MASLRDLEFRHLQALVAVADERSFGRAATRLGFTQSAVSQQVAALERVVGAPVFDRPGGPRPVELTPTGTLLLEHARTILDRVRLAEDDLARLEAGDSGRIVLGTFQSVSVRLLPAIIGQLRAERPEVEIRLVESDDQEELYRALLDGDLDATFVANGAGRDRIEFVPLCEDPYRLLTAAGAEPPLVSLARLRDLPLIGQPNCACQQYVDRALMAAGVTPNYVFRSADNATVQAMVRVGMGYAVMPALAIDETDPGVELCELDPPVPPRTISLATRHGRTRSAALERFVELAREVCSPVAR